VPDEDLILGRNMSH